ncbi:uncharacterized protein PHACADRAFT_203745 [Phanerochaete carnosa HHB-10118-sp]|uniref:MYND-type domain-containing protein n=1 Tax=Phanerochaete carnosa (strain HHB-10118-sp) TaxID=650164 RepID=K5XC52_PHACS|nr:uncharacterized protein PHACADRAFT_203745 [Phanerochaete carnosa HHB-10118-sp]EKM60567.1 hypothetical protein PHACADRAFT_203745 [Phanerochaete carnosa HHB-10118-sp]
MSTPTANVGSCADGGFLNDVGCAAFLAGVQAEGCDQSGVQLCSNCRLVKYCSPLCQTSHWR